MVGVESQDYREEAVRGDGKNLYIPGSWVLSNTIDSWTVAGATAALAHRSVFGRVKYDFGGRYYATASIRSDASSRFHPDHRWGTFWSASFGWDINKENFLKEQTWIDLLKFKASFGQNGNDNISTSQYINYMDFYAISGANGGATPSSPTRAIPKSPGRRATTSTSASTSVSGTASSAALPSTTCVRLPTCCSTCPQLPRSATAASPPT